MIPLRLRLWNFLSYREEELSLEGVHVACLCGENGAGKSALLDAITWALWGQARNVDRRGSGQENLIHQGQEEMAVELDFRVGENRYRVVRRYSRKRGPSLHLLIASGDGFRTLSQGVEETQKRLLEILRLDYDTFTHSAFLVQGQDDAFTAGMDPRQRKELLGKVLGLSLYEAAAEEARSLSRERKKEKERLDGELALIEEELDQRPLYEGEMARLSHQLQETEEKARQAQEKLNTLRLREGALRQKEARLTKIEKELEDIAREEDFWKREIAAREKRLGELQGYLARRGEIEKGHQALLETRQALERLSQKQRAFLALREELEPLRLQLHGLKVRTEQESKTALGLPLLEQKLSHVKKGLESLQEQQKGLEAEKEGLRGLADGLRQQEAALARLVAGIEETAQKLHLLAGAEARCPLCENALGTEKRHTLQARYQAEEGERARQQEKVRAACAELDRDLRDKDKEAREKEKALHQERASLESQHALVEDQAREAREAGKRLRDMEGTLQGLEQTLSRLEGEVRALGYDEAAYLKAQQDLKGLEPFEPHKQRLLEAEKDAPTEAQALESAREKQAKQETKRSLALEEKGALASDLASQPHLKQALSQTEDDYVQSRAEGDRLREAVGRVRGRLEDLHRREGEKGLKAKERQRAGEEEGIYAELAEAFGPKGAPALIIERALPELEEDANALLARMTQGRLTLRFETQEATKSGGVVETLDIAVADERGTRSYAMFSGGEAFRINLALRIALAKFLARRAGAPLPILVVDEGFGSQDAEGRERLVEAINSIAPDFEKVILVTHIEELKEMFPVRLEVTRGPNGSRVTLSA